MPYYPPLSGSSGYNLIEDEGTALPQRTTIDFVGAGVTASDVGGETRVTITGGGGGGNTATTIEVNLGSIPVSAGRFTITDSNISSSSKILCWQAPGPYTGKGTRADEAEMDYLTCIAYPQSGSAIVVWKTTEGDSPFFPKAEGNLLRSSLSTLASPQDDPQARIVAQRIGKVKGNFKFNYVIF